MKRTIPSRSTSGYATIPSSNCKDKSCDCGPTVFVDPLDLLRFLSGRFKYAGATHLVLLTYAADIDATLAAYAKRPTKRSKR